MIFSTRWLLGLVVLMLVLVVRAAKTSADEGGDDLVEQELVKRLLRIQRNPHGEAGLSGKEQSDNNRWFTENRSVVCRVAERELTEAILKASDARESKESVRYDLWLSAVSRADKAYATRLCVDLFIQVDRILTFVDPLYRQGAPVHPSKALGMAAYQKAIAYIQVRNLLFFHLTILGSDAVVDRAKELVDSEMSTSIHAVRYLESQADHHPNLKAFLSSRESKEGGVRK